jgi:hypothetical protein
MECRNSGIASALHRWGGRTEGRDNTSPEEAVVAGSRGHGYMHRRRCRPWNGAGNSKNEVQIIN